MSTLIIAEAGVNHNGSMEIARQMIDKAKESGADIIKFQTAKVDSLVSKFAKMADYQKRNIGEETSQRKMLEGLLLDFDCFIELKNYCDEVGIAFLSTPFDIDSIRFLNNLQNIWKIPSGEITNYPYLVEIGKTGKAVIMSTGMSTIHEIREAINVLRENGSEDIKLMHCNTQYPTPFKDVNLRAMETIKKETGCQCGYSDHTLGIEVPIAAVAMGAPIIEKHFTLDRTMSGPDHKASLEPEELRLMITAIRNIEESLGDGKKKVTDSERENIAVARKSIVAKRNINKDELFSEENITTKRPGMGISPMKWNSLLGKKAKRAFKEDEVIEI